ncbi:MAG: hypothetical protein ABI790_13470 [Betaproteobacteria bacterium]
MKRHVITAAFLLAAAVFYEIGFGLGVGLALVAGFVSEMIFWVRISRALSAPRSHKANTGT